MITVVYDGAHVALGRLASIVAKQALLGKNVVVINCEEILVSGARKTTVEAYKEIRAKGGYSQKGPYFPTQPAMIVKRTIRGMLSYKEGRGATAFKKIKCYEGTPKEFIESKKENVVKATHIATTTLKEISEELR
ncbi:MAG: 50S ribosomal protein L13 [Candidatus Pacearchaeota archaeon]